MFARTVIGRAAARVQQRGYATAAPGSANDFIAQREAVKHHAAGSASLWRKITYFVAFPTIVAGYLNGENLAEEHHKHVEHIKEENGGQLPERIRYPYMRKRDKSFPWPSNETLFFNPEVNIGPSGDDE